MPGVVAAPGLRETADIWFDTGRDPVVRWDDSGCRFELCDPEDDDQRLLLLQTARPVPDPERIAGALAEGLAACDFPPTAESASRTHVLAALRAAGIDLETFDPEDPS